MSDYELLYYIFQNDEEALDMLINKHEKNIFFCVKKTLEKYNYSCTTSDEFGEILHLGKLEFYQSIYRYCDDGRCSFLVFSQKCIEMAVRKYIRHRRGLTTYHFSNALSLDKQIKENEGIYYVDMVQDRRHDYEGDAITKWYHKENLMQFLEDHLKENEYEIVKLKLEGYSQIEISEMLLISRKRVYYVCNKMRKLLLSYID